jgi:hypothetical protein
VRLLRSIWAVIAGTAVDMFLTIALTWPLLIWVSFDIPLDLSPDQENQALVSASMSNPVVFGIGLMLGCFASVAGGYVGAAIARRAPLLHGALTAWFCVYAVVIELVNGRSGWPWWLILPLAPLAPALAALGGAAWQRHSARFRATPPLVRASMVRRAAMVVAYGALLTIVIAVSLALSVDSECAQYQLCSVSERATSQVHAWAFMVLIPLVILGGYFGFLPGARNRRASSGSAPAPPSLF